MEHWLFHRVTETQGSGWRWQCKDHDGNLVAASGEMFSSYPDCLGDAMRHGYLSDVKTCGDVEMER